MSLSLSCDDFLVDVAACDMDTCDSEACMGCNAENKQLRRKLQIWQALVLLMREDLSIKDEQLDYLYKV